MAEFSVSFESTNELNAEFDSKYIVQKIEKKIAGMQSSSFVGVDLSGQTVSNSMIITTEAKGEKI